MPRHDLCRSIEDAGVPVLFVVAPSGFGKSSLLADWASTTATEVAWFGCTETDAEPTQFWPRLVSTLTTRWPAMGSDAALLLERPSWDGAELVAALGRDLAEVPAEAAAIVVDDCQFAESSQRALTALAQVLPRSVRLVVATQHNPVFSTSRLRVAGLLAELRSADLAFTQAESDELLRLSGLDLAPGARRRLHTLTQGWPAGLRLAVLAMRNADDPEQVIDAFARTTREVSDYLANEVIDRLAPELTDFMTSISVLDEFDVELCQAITGRNDTDRFLGRIIGDDLFIQPADPAGERFRFHPMFAAFLRARLKSLGEEALRKTQLRALEALHARGDLPAALRHAMALGDVQGAAALVSESMVRGLEVGDAQDARAVARAWLARFGEAAAETEPQQLLEIVLVLTGYGARDAERWLVALDRGDRDRSPHEEALLHGVWADYLLNRGQAASCLERNRRARQAVSVAVEQGAVFPRLAELPMQEAGAHLLCGDAPAAAAALERAGPVPHPLVDEFRVPVLRYWIAFLEGDLALAQQSLGRVGESGAEQAAVAYGLGRIFLNMIRAGCHLERRELGPASAALAEASEAAEVNGRPVIQSLVDLWLARLAIAQGSHETAGAALAQARLVLADPDARVQAQLALEEFRIAVAFRPNVAGDWVPRLPAGNESRLLRARLLVGRRGFAQAGQILATVQPLTLRERIQWGVLQSLAAQDGDLARAHGHLRTALELAEPHGYLATILEQGRGVVAVLRSLPVGGTLKPYLDTLAAAAQTLGSQAPGSVAVAPGDLSSRERTVLGLLSSRLTSHEIAGTLFVSPNTLKSHMKSIYRKLDVTSRAEAVRQGQARGLL